MIANIGTAVREQVAGPGPNGDLDAVLLLARHLRVPVERRSGLL